MNRIWSFLKKELMLTLSLLAAGLALLITQPTARLLQDINWHTLGILLMMLCVLEGFKQENLLRPPHTRARLAPVPASHPFPPRAAHPLP